MEATRTFTAERDLPEMADRLLPEPQRQESMVRYTSDTEDIIEAIAQRYEVSKNDTRSLAPHFMAGNTHESLRRLWAFVRGHIHYIEDTQGYQWIKSPARTWADRTADCKSYSIFIGSVLYHLGIPFSFRFVDFGSGQYTHVYVVARPVGQRAVLLDACMPQFDREKPFKQKQDKPMPTRIAHLTGTADTTAAAFPELLADVPAARAYIEANKTRLHIEGMNIADLHDILDTAEQLFATGEAEVALKLTAMLDQFNTVHRILPQRQGAQPGIQGSGSSYFAEELFGTAQPYIGVPVAAAAAAGGGGAAAGGAAGSGAFGKVLSKALAPIVESVGKALGKFLGGLFGPKIQPEVQRWKDWATVVAYWIEKYWMGDPGEVNHNHREGLDRFQYFMVEGADYHVRENTGELQRATDFFMQKYGMLPADLILAYATQSGAADAAQWMAQAEQQNAEKEKAKASWAANDFFMEKTPWIAAESWAGIGATWQRILDWAKTVKRDELLKAIEEANLTQAELDKQAPAGLVEQLLPPAVLKTIGYKPGDTRTFSQLLNAIPKEVAATLDKGVQSLIQKVNPHQITDPGYGDPQGGSDTLEDPREDPRGDTSQGQQPIRRGTKTDPQTAGLEQLAPIGIGLGLLYFLFK